MLSVICLYFPLICGIKINICQKVDDSLLPEVEIYQEKSPKLTEQAASRQPCLV